MGKDFKYQVKINNKKSIQEIMALMERRQKEMYEPIGAIQYINDYIKKQIDKENEIVESAVFEEIRKFGINIDKDELIKALNYDRQQYEKGYQDGLNADKWIPCSERMPEEREIKGVSMSEVVMVTVYDIEKDEVMGVNCDMTINGEWQGYQVCAGTDVIAWQPLPEPYPYKESDNNE